MFLFAQLKSEVLLAISMNCHGLEELDLAGLNIVEDAVLFSIAENCPKLRRINIKSCTEVNSTDIYMVKSVMRNNNGFPSMQCLALFCIVHV